MKDFITFMVMMGLMMIPQSPAQAGRSLTAFTTTKTNILKVITRFEAICKNKNNRLNDQTCGPRWNEHLPILSRNGLKVKPFYSETHRNTYPKRFQKRFGFKIQLRKGYVEASRIQETVFEHETLEKVISWVHVAFYHYGRAIPRRIFAGPLDRQFKNPPETWAQVGLEDNPSKQFYKEGIEDAIRLIDDFRWTMSDRGGYKTDYLIPRTKN